MSDSENTAQRSARRVGRPATACPRLKEFKIRTNPEEEATLLAAASAACLPLATYVRLRALGPVRFPVPRADLQTAAELARIGNLFNQAVALAHRGSAPAWPSGEMAELQALCGHIAVLLTDPRARTLRELENTDSILNPEGEE
jgi:mobilization protein NikA